MRFFLMVAHDPATGCWLWTGHKNRKGYGDFSVSHGRVVLAHRFSFKHAFGAIPDGMCVLHRCDTPACVRPSHLFLGTRTDNNADMMAKGRYATGESNGQSKLDTRTVLAIRDAFGPHAVIGAAFGVHQSTVTRIKNGKVWKELR